MKKNIAAFFDVDDTLINIKSMFSFWGFLLTHSDVDITQKKHIRSVQFELDQLRKEKKPRETLNIVYYKSLKGFAVTCIERFAKQWFSDLNKSELFNPLALTQLRLHQQKNQEVVFVSGSCAALLTPIASHLSVTNLLCAPLSVENGIYTGKLYSQAVIGEGKAMAIRKYCVDKNCDLSASFAYGDDISDIPMLSLVGYPRLVNSDESVARKYHRLKIANTPELVVM